MDDTAADTPPHQTDEQQPSQNGAHPHDGVVGRQPFGKLAVEQGLITPLQLADAFAEQFSTGGKLGEILQERGLVTADEVERLLALQNGLPYEPVERPEGEAGEPSAEGEGDDGAPQPGAAPTTIPLGKLAVDEGVITQMQLSEAFAAQFESGQKLGEVLLARDLVTEDVLDRLLKLQQERPYADEGWRAPEEPPPGPSVAEDAELVPGGDDDEHAAEPEPHPAQALAAEPQEPREGEPLPDLSGIGGLIDDLYGLAASVADARLARAEAEARATAAESEAEEQRQAAARVESQLTRLAEELEGAKKDVAIARAARAEAEQTVAALQAAAEQRDLVAAEHRQKLERLKGLLDDV